jgi:hypothetical protein
MTISQESITKVTAASPTLDQALDVLVVAAGHLDSMIRADGMCRCHLYQESKSGTRCSTCLVLQKIVAVLRRANRSGDCPEAWR